MWQDWPELIVLPWQLSVAWNGGASWPPVPSIVTGSDPRLVTETDWEGEVVPVITGPNDRPVGVINRFAFGADEATTVIKARVPVTAPMTRPNRAMRRSRC